MPQRLQDLWEWAHTHQGKKVLRFTSVSVISTAVSFTSISVLYGFHLVKGVIWATVLGNLVATIPSYYLNRTWTWGRRGRSHFFTEIVPFWTMSFLGIGVSMLGAAWAKSQVHGHHWSHAVNTMLVSTTNLASFGLFWILKMMVFNRIFKDHTLEEIDEHLSAEEAMRA